MKQPKRKPWVCAENQCKKCQTWTPDMEVREGCPFAILHALDMTQTGLVDKPRRWGKTRHLIEVIVSFLETNNNVAVICRDVAQRELLIYRMRQHAAMSRLLKTHGRSFLAISLAETEGVSSRLRGFPRSAVFTDEIMPEQFERLKSQLESHDFVLGYYSSRG